MTTKIVIEMSVVVISCCLFLHFWALWVEKKQAKKMACRKEVTSPVASNFVRSQLTATRDGIPEPKLEVEEWISSLDDLIEELVEPCPACVSIGDNCGGVSGHRNCGGMGINPDPQESYDLLALTAKLRRTKPELVVECEGTEILQRAETLLQKFGAELARQALSVLNPQAWLAAASEFANVVDELSEADEVEQAVELLEDLDDAELVLATAWRCGVVDPELQAGVTACMEWLSEHADVFLAASVYVQAVGMTIPPDLDSRDYELAATSLKYLDLLDAAETAEADMSLANVKPMSAEVLRGLVKSLAQ